MLFCKLHTYILLNLIFHNLVFFTHGTTLPNKLREDLGISFSKIGILHNAVNVLDLLVAIKTPEFEMEKFFKNPFLGIVNEYCNHTDGGNKIEVFMGVICTHIRPLIQQFKIAELDQANSILQTLLSELPQSLPGYAWLDHQNLESYINIVQNFLVNSILKDTIASNSYTDLHKSYMDAKALLEQQKLHRNKRSNMKTDTFHNDLLNFIDNLDQYQNLDSTSIDLSFQEQLLSYMDLIDVVSCPDRSRDLIISQLETSHKLLNISKAQETTTRTKRFISSLISIVSNGISMYKTHVREKKISRGMNRLFENDHKLFGQINVLKNELLALARTSLGNFQKLELSVNSNVEEIGILNSKIDKLYVKVKNNNINFDHAIYLITATCFKLIPYMNNLLRYLREFKDTLYKFMIDLTHLHEGYLSYNLLKPSVLKQYLTEIGNSLLVDHPGYQLVYPDVEVYYSLPFINYHFEEITQQLVLEIPIYISDQLNNEMTLFQLNIVPIPIDFLDTSDSKEYTMLKTSTNRIAMAADSFIQVSLDLLNTCHNYRSTYICETNIMVDHDLDKNCLASIYFNQIDSIIKQNCQFELLINYDLKPQILEGENKIAVFAPRQQQHLVCRTNLKPDTLKPNDFGILVIEKSKLCQCDVIIDQYKIYSNLQYCTDYNIKFRFNYTENKIWNLFQLELGNKPDFKDELIDTIKIENRKLSLDLNELEKMSKSDDIYLTGYDNLKHRTSDANFYNGKSLIKSTIFFGCILSLLLVIILVIAYCKMKFVQGIVLKHIKTLVNQDKLVSMSEMCYKFKKHFICCKPKMDLPLPKSDRPVIILE